MWEVIRRWHRSGIALGVVMSCAARAVVAAPTEYSALALYNAPQAAYDAAESRPDLLLGKAATGAINLSGQLTGKGDAGVSQLNQDARPFFYDPLEHTHANLGDLTNDFADPLVSPRNDASYGMGINDAGWVVGVSSTGTAAGVADDRPFLWVDDDANHANTLGEMHELGLNPGAAYGSALRINNSGQALITGDSGLYRATLALNGGAVSEPTARVFIGAATQTADINGAGNVAYTLGTAGYVWRDMNTDNTADAGEITQIPFMSVTHPSTSVFAINNTGQVVGSMRNDQSRDVGFIWTDVNGDNQVDWADTNGNGYFEWNETSGEVVRFHGHAGGINAAAGNTFVFDINDQGLAVGGYFDSSNRRAFIFDPIDGMLFLDDLIDQPLTIQLRQADAINNNGRIAAFGRSVGESNNKLVLLTPTSVQIGGDLDGDGFVGIADLNIVLGNWNQNVTPGDLSLGDPSGDGFVGIDDLNAVLGNWNAGAPPGTGSNIPEPVCVFAYGVVCLLLSRRG